MLVKTPLTEIENEMESETATQTDEEIFTVLNEKYQARTGMVPMNLIRRPFPAYHADRNPEVNPARLAELKGHLKAAGGFSRMLCQDITVSLAADGWYDLIDGVGRVVMGTDLSVPAITELQGKIYNQMPIADQIRLFKALGRQVRPITKLDDWFADKDEPGYEWKLKIIDTCKTFGFRLQGARRTAGQTITLNAALFLYALGVLDKTLAHINNVSAWNQSDNLRSVTVVSVGVLEYIGADLTRLRKTLAEVTPGALYISALKRAGKMEMLKPQTRQLAWIGADLLLAEYNARRGAAGTKLTDPEATELKDFPQIVDFKDVYCPHAPKKSRNPS